MSLGLSIAPCKLLRRGGGCRRAAWNDSCRFAQRLEEILYVRVFAGLYVGGEGRKRSDEFILLLFLSLGRCADVDFPFAIDLDRDLLLRRAGRAGRKCF